MGASCGHQEVHGASNGDPETVSVTLGPFACFCMQTAKASEGTHILKLGETGNTLVLQKVDGYRPSAAVLADRVPSRLETQPMLPPTRTMSGLESPGGAPPSSGSARGERTGSVIGEVTHFLKEHIHFPGKAAAASHLEPLPAAILGGRVVEAARLIAEMEARAEGPSRVFIQQQAMDRIKRTSACFTESLEELRRAAPKDWHVEQDDGEGHRVDFRVSGDVLRVVSVSEHSDLDLLRAFAALCEVDLLFRHTDDRLQSISEFGARADESFWRVIKDREKQENLHLASYVDALDEDLSMLWVSIQGLDLKPRQSQYHGVPLPRESDGYMRSKPGDAVYGLVRLRSTARSGEPQKNTFRLIAIHSQQLSRAGKCYYSLNPRGWYSRRCFFKQMSIFINGFKDLAGSQALEKRMQENARRDFYSQIQRHLEASAESTVVE